MWCSQPGGLPVLWFRALAAPLLTVLLKQAAIQSEGRIVSCWDLPARKGWVWGEYCIDFPSFTGDDITTNLGNDGHC